VKVYERVFTTHFKPVRFGLSSFRFSIFPSSSYHNTLLRSPAIFCHRVYFLIMSAAFISDNEETVSVDLRDDISVDDAETVSVDLRDDISIDDSVGNAGIRLPAAMRCVHPSSSTSSHPPSLAIRTASDTCWPRSHPSSGRSATTADCSSAGPGCVRGANPSFHCCRAPSTVRRPSSPRWAGRRPNGTVGSS
jgi:hypothetical protein